MRTSKYLGPVWERFTERDGTITVRKLHLYWLRGQSESRLALTEEDALAAVAAHG